MLISGAGSGVGRACALAFAERGAELILSDIDVAALGWAGREFGGFTRTCDVCCEASVGAFAADVLSHFSSVDVLINAAGRRYVRTLGMMRMTHAFLPAMIAEGREADVVSVAPMGGFIAGTSQFPYAASQEAFGRISEALAFEVRGTNVTVTSIVPHTRKSADHLGREASRANPAAPYTYWLESFDPDRVAEQIVAAVQPTVSSQNAGGGTAGRPARSGRC